MYVVLRTLSKQGALHWEGRHRGALHRPTAIPDQEGARLAIPIGGAYWCYPNVRGPTFDGPVGPGFIVRSR